MLNSQAEYHLIHFGTIINKPQVLSERSQGEDQVFRYIKKGLLEKIVTLPLFLQFFFTRKTAKRYESKKNDGILVKRFNPGQKYKI